LLPLTDFSTRPSPGPDALVVRAVFVPDGEQPPRELAADFYPPRLRAILDPATRQITGDNARMASGDDIRAQWYPLNESESEFAEELTDQGSDAPDNGEA
jgi:hypothetical protein